MEDTDVQTRYDLKVLAERNRLHKTETGLWTIGPAPIANCWSYAKYSEGCPKPGMTPERLKNF